MFNGFDSILNENRELILNKREGKKTKRISDFGF